MEIPCANSTHAAHPDSQLVPLLALIPGSIIAGFQGLSALGHFLVLWLGRAELEQSFPDAQPITTGTSDILRAAGHALPNIGLAILCIAAMILVVRSSRRGSSKLTLVGLVVVAGVGVMTFTPIALTRAGSI